MDFSNVSLVLRSPDTLTTTTPIPTNHSSVRILDILVGLVMGVTIEQDAGGFVKDRFYAGSRLLQFITDWSGIPIDMVNFVVASFVSLPLALFMRYALPPSRVRPIFRAIVEILLGAGVVVFCFGMQLRVLLLQSAVAYVMLLLCRRDRFITPVAVTVWSLLYLMLIHQCRLYYDYEGYTLDISGAIMLQTQRLSSLAFNLYDGARIAKSSASLADHKTSHDEEGRVNDKNANDDDDDATKAIIVDYSQEPKIEASSRECAVVKMPGLVEFAAYCMYFHGVCIGPFVFFKDYHNYLHGYDNKHLPPLPLRRLLYLTLRMALYGLTYAALFNRIPISFINHEAFRVSHLSCLPSSPIFLKVLVSLYSSHFYCDE